MMNRTSTGRFNNIACVVAYGVFFRLEYLVADWSKWIKLKNAIQLWYVPFEATRLMARTEE